MSCTQLIFTNCAGVRAKRLDIKAKLSGDVPIEFHNADGGVCVPTIDIHRNGELRAVLCNRWKAGNERGGFFSLLHYAEKLAIEYNPQALSDLLAYVEGSCDLGGQWEYRELSRGLEVIIDCTERDLQVV